MVNVPCCILEVLKKSLHYSAIMIIVISMIIMV